MAISSLGSAGTGIVGATPASTVTMTHGTGRAAGTCFICTVVTSDTVTHDSVADSAGNTFAKIADSNGNGQRVSTWLCKTTNAVTTSTTLTATLSASVADSCIGASAYSVASGYTLASAATPQLTTTTGVNGFGSASFASLPSLARLYYRSLGKNAAVTTAITATTNFSSTGWTVRSRNNAAARIVRAEFRLNTSTGETSNPTLANTGDSASTFVALDEVVEPVSINPGTSGATVGANAPGLSVLVDAGTAGVTVGANAPTLTGGGVDVEPAAAGVTVGAVAPQLAAEVAPGVAGVVAGAAAPSLSATIAPTPAGVTAGGVAPSLSASLGVGVAGVTLGAWAPSLSASVAPGVAGVTVGAVAPTLDTGGGVNVEPSPAGVTLSALAPGLSVSVSPSTAGVVAGGVAPALLVGVSPASAGAVVGAWAPSLTVGVLPSTAGAVLGAFSPTLAVVVLPGVAGLEAGAWSPSAGEFVPHYARPGETVEVSTPAPVATSAAGAATVQATDTTAEATVPGPTGVTTS